MTLYDLQQHRAYIALYEADLGVWTLSHAAVALWCLGYPDQALQKSHEALTLAQKLAHPNSLGWALCCAAWLHQYRREPQETQRQTETVITLSNEHGFPLWLAHGTILRGWALAMQGQGEEGVAQIHEGMAAWRALGTEMAQTHFLALLAEAYGKMGQSKEGLSVLSEALDFVNKTGERVYEAELYRMKGTLTLQSQASHGQVPDKSQTSHGQAESKSEVTNPQPLTPNSQAEAEACFHKAIEVARKQQAKSLELRAVMSLARLWQQRGRKDEARQMLTEIYDWFTEGFATKDLQEAKELLEELA